VHIRLEGTDHRISVLIEDDGVGFDSGSAMTLREGLRGIGLLGMRERAALLGGTLVIESQIGQGARVRAEVPWKREE
jgi:signal transduction histidine kinase